MRILITGGAGGIAYALAKNLTERGHLVYLTTHTKEQCTMLKKRLVDEKLEMLCFKLDITNAEDRKLIDKIDFDCLINHAGIGIGGSLLEMDINGLKENYEVNIFSSFTLLKQVYKKWQNKKVKGKIFVTSSLAGVLPIPFLGCYTSSKAAISQLVFTIKKELEYLKSDITITLVEPGAYNTGFNQVMIDNKDKYLYKNSVFYQDRESINKLQRNMFCLIESKNIDKFVKKIVKQIESKNPKFRIRYPYLQVLFTKLYVILYR